MPWFILFCTAEPGAAVPPTVVSARPGPYSYRTNDSCCFGVTTFLDYYYFHARSRSGRDEHPGIFIEIVCSFWNWEETGAKGKDYGEEGVGDQKSNCLMALAM